MAKLFIVGFPKDTEEIELVELFNIHGTVNTVTIVTDQQSGESKGYGFVTMTDDAGAQRAILALNGASLGGRTLNVRSAEDKAPYKPVTQTSFVKAKPSFVRRENRTETPRPKRPRKQ